MFVSCANQKAIQERCLGIEHRSYQNGKASRTSAYTDGHLVLDSRIGRFGNLIMVAACFRTHESHGLRSRLSARINHSDPPQSHQASPFDIRASMQLLLNLRSQCMRFRSQAFAKIDAFITFDNFDAVDEVHYIDEYGRLKVFSDAGRVQQHVQRLSLFLHPSRFALTPSFFACLSG